MAIDKKSFIMYADQLELFEELSDQNAGELIKHVLRYINDMQPITVNPMVKLSFIPIKQHLKRDLKRFDAIKEKRSLAGKKSAELRALNKITPTHVESVPTKPTHVESVQQTSTNPTDNENDNENDNDNDNDNVNDIKKETVKKIVFNFRKSLLNLGIEKTLVDDFLKNRKLKKLANTETAFKNLKNEFEKNGTEINVLFENVVSKGWGSFKNSWSDKLPKTEKTIGESSNGSELLNIKNPNK